MESIKDLITSGGAIVGIEFGSTRIKAVLVDSDNAPQAMGSHTWENSLVVGIWTYSEEEIISGLQAAYADFSFTDVLWPDFDKAEFDKALASFSKRERRMGGRL